MTDHRAAPIRDGSREGSAGCPVCAGPLPSSRAHYCSRACQQRAYRLRHHTEAADLGMLRRQLQQRRALVAHTIYECPSCSERLVGERRCPDCRLFGRSLGLGGPCPDCDQPILLTDLLGLADLGAPPPPRRQAARRTAPPLRSGPAGDTSPPRTGTWDGSPANHPSTTTEGQRAHSPAQEVTP